MTHPDRKRAVSVFILVSIVFSLFVLSGCENIPFISKLFPSSSKKTESPAVTQPSFQGTLLARVDNWVITLEDFNQKVDSLNSRLKPEERIETIEQKKAFLNDLISQQLLVKEARARGVDKRKEIKEAIEEMENSLLIASLSNQLLEDVKVESKDIEDYYNKNKEIDPNIKEPTQWHIGEIVVSTPTQASDILIELLKGADFAGMARQYSKASSAKNGGDLGLLDQEKVLQMAPPLQIAVVSLETGGLSNVIKGPDGFYILKLEEKKGGKERSLSDVWDYIKNGLTMVEQGKRIQEHIEALRQKSSLEIRGDLIK